MILIVANSRHMRGNLWSNVSGDFKSAINYEGVHEQTNRTGFTTGGLVKDSQQWASSRFNDVLQICSPPRHEQEADLINSKGQRFVLLGKFRLMR